MALFPPASFTADFSLMGVRIPVVLYPSAYSTHNSSLHAHARAVHHLVQCTAKGIAAPLLQVAGYQEFSTSLLF